MQCNRKCSHVVRGIAETVKDTVVVVTDVDVAVGNAVDRVKNAR
jgi:hypothetical protein